MLGLGIEMPPPKGRVSRHQGKRTSTVTLVLSMLLMLSVVLLMLLALGILSLPVGSDKEPTSVGNPIKFKRMTLDMYDVFIFYLFF